MKTDGSIRIMMELCNQYLAEYRRLLVCVDENSYMVTGWYRSGEEWYYLADNGQMQTGWFTQDGEEYYLDPDTGVMARNTTIDGHEMNSSGVKVS